MLYSYEVTTNNMVCAKCQKIAKTTSLATPAVKKKNDMYLGSPAGSSKSGDKTKTSATQGSNAIGKVGFLHRNGIRTC